MNKRVPNVVRGGQAIPMGNNFYYMRGRKHKDGGIDIGSNPRTGLEVEGGEIIQTSPKELKIFSAQPILNGKSPAKLVLGGANPNKVFEAQERYKENNNLNDDGTMKQYRNRKSTLDNKNYINVRVNGNVIDKIVGRRNQMYSPSPTGERKQAALGTKESYITINGKQYKKGDTFTYNGKTYKVEGTNTFLTYKELPNNNKISKDVRNAAIRDSKGATIKTRLDKKGYVPNNNYSFNNNRTNKSQNVIYTNRVKSSNIKTNTAKTNAVKANTAKTNVNNKNTNTVNKSVNVNSVNNSSKENNELRSFTTPIINRIDSDYGIGKQIRDINEKLYDIINFDKNKKVNTLPNKDIESYKTTVNDKVINTATTAPRRGNTQSKTITTATPNTTNVVNTVSTATVKPVVRTTNNKQKVVTTSPTKRTITKPVINKPVTNKPTTVKPKQKIVTTTVKPVTTQVSTTSPRFANLNTMMQGLPTEFNRAKYAGLEREIPDTLPTFRPNTNGNNKRKALFNKLDMEDAAGLGLNLAGTIAGGVNTIKALNKMTPPAQPRAVVPERMKTTIDINQQLAEAEEQAKRYINDINSNTNSSKGRLQRIQRVRNENMNNRNRLINAKTNAETELYNKDVANRQQINAINTAAYNDWLKDFRNFRNEVTGQKASSVNNIISGMNASFQDLLNRRENRRNYKNTLGIYAATHPNVSRRLFEDYGLEF